ncbi:hypothetical protein B0H15DRAFT_981187 [Mycena belliarum]|uniref:Uncharacterized protein n=1 Tax=Mycena belliarum TaxID=1033014 RepID=A0AAD6XS77_9AGAR|nr:hypothetical protein B0H15DRAFT_981187 [Mycena belliae]
MLSKMGTSFAPPHISCRTRAWPLRATRARHRRVPTCDPFADAHAQTPPFARAPTQRTRTCAGRGARERRHRTALQSSALSACGAEYARLDIQDGAFYLPTTYLPANPTPPRRPHPHPYACCLPTPCRTPSPARDSAARSADAASRRDVAASSHARAARPPPRWPVVAFPPLRGGAARVYRQDAARRRATRPRSTRGIPAPATPTSAQPASVPVPCTSRPRGPARLIPKSLQQAPARPSRKSRSKAPDLRIAKVSTTRGARPRAPTNALGLAPSNSTSAGSADARTERAGAHHGREMQPRGRPSRCLPLPVAPAAALKSCARRPSTDAHAARLPLAPRGVESGAQRVPAQRTDAGHENDDGPAPAHSPPPCARVRPTAPNTSLWASRTRYLRCALVHPLSTFPLPTYLPTYPPPHHLTRPHPAASIIPHPLSHTASRPTHTTRAASQCCPRAVPCRARSPARDSAARCARAAPRREVTWRLRAPRSQGPPTARPATPACRVCGGNIPPTRPPARAVHLPTKYPPTDRPNPTPPRRISQVRGRAGRTLGRQSPLAESAAASSPPALASPPKPARRVCGGDPSPRLPMSRDGFSRQLARRDKTPARSSAPALAPRFRARQGRGVRAPSLPLPPDSLRLRAIRR